jgi:hypothetical protein
MSAERATFLDDLIVTLIENFHTLTWFHTEEYDCPDDGPVTAPGSTDPDRAQLVNADTGQLLYVSPHHRRRVLAAPHDGDGADMDVIDASAIAECALYGQVVYASASPTNATTPHRPPTGGCWPSRPSRTTAPVAAPITGRSGSTTAKNTDSCTAAWVSASTSRSIARCT